eukprot:Gregarina_sp_Poly_1__278@NODE_1068_length_5192_cov_185_777756_g194_i1_p4_GENE_NODE_1068_length_5192_cov_185_777756_g194_i1NODE_1068_length_5192_cov_185_777756_g194_i1_p4_ORF_typecomplete_len131_score7_92_NODE_1068_length_5192_cov_185_777756_g194_i178470
MSTSYKFRAKIVQCPSTIFNIYLNKKRRRKREFLTCAFQLQCLARWIKGSHASPDPSISRSEVALDGEPSLLTRVVGVVSVSSRLKFTRAVCSPGGSSSSADPRGKSAKSKSSSRLRSIWHPCKCGDGYT